MPGGVTVPFPFRGMLTNAYDIIHPNASDTATVRSVFIIGPDNKLKLTLTSTSCGPSSSA